MTVQRGTPKERGGALLELEGRGSPPPLSLGFPLCNPLSCTLSPPPGQPMDYHVVVFFKLLLTITLNCVIALVKDFLHLKSSGNLHL